VLEHIDSQLLNWENGVVAFNAGAVPVRYVLERRRWEEAASLPVPEEAEAAGGNYETRALVALRYWARAVGAARSGEVARAESALMHVEEIAPSLAHALHMSSHIFTQVGMWDESIDANTRSAEAARLSPGRVLPVHEQLGDMLMELGRPEEALKEYEISLQHASRRFNSIYGAARAAQAAGKSEVAETYYRQLLELADPASPRPELTEARSVG
jgi:tetratricopeptide (TPR) repeat protein